VRRWWPRAVLDANPDPIAEHIGQHLGDGDESVLTTVVRVVVLRVTWTGG